MQPNSGKFDVAILGSGIAGSTLAAILARQGLKVVLFEAGSHPKFAIGESMILETSEMMRSLADLYDLPELAYFSSENYFEHIGTSHGVKRHFSYAHHSEGQAFDRQHTLQAVIPRQPHGHELHLYRQDTDYFLMTLAIRQGAKVFQNTPVESVEIDGDAVHVLTTSGQSFQAEYVVDACGFRSLLAEKFDLRHHDLETHSRAIFTHMVEVPCFHEVTAPQDDYQLPFQLSEGTLHHVFEGGWLWVIPFDNHAKSTNPLCSVGLMLDPRVHPAQPDLSPEAEFFQFIERFPSIADQFRRSKAVRGWTRTGRLQYSAKQVVGDRFCLLGQAAGFIDPLFSKGLYTALTCTSVLAERLLAAQKTRDYSAANFQSVEDLTLAYIEANDQLVANAYRSFADYRLWSPFSVLWLLGAYLELVKLTSARAQLKEHHSPKEYYRQLAMLRQVGGGFPEFEQLSNQICQWLVQVNPGDTHVVIEVGEQIKQRLHQTPWMPFVFKAILDGKNHLPNHKLHPRLLRPKQGFFGSGAYRQHFFGDRNLPFFINFYLRERARYSQQVLNLQRSIRQWKQGLIRPLHLGSVTALSTMIATGFLLAHHNRTVPSLAANGLEQQSQAVVGLVNFLQDSDGFRFMCGRTSGKIVDATLEGDRLTLEIEYPQDSVMQEAVLTGNFNAQGLFRGTYQTSLPNGLFTGEVRLDFEQDGSAQGLNHEGGEISIRRS